MSLLLDQFNRLLAPLRQRVLSMVARAVVRAVEEDEGLRRLTVGALAGEEIAGVEQMQEYGFASQPLRGCEAVVLFAGGDRNHGYIINTDDPRFRPLGLAPGEVAVYGQGDALAEGEEAPEFPGELPQGWPPAPGEDDPPMARQRLLFKAGREVVLYCDDFKIAAQGNIDLMALGAIRMQSMAGLSLAAATQIDAGLIDNMRTIVGFVSGELVHLARIGDCVVVSEGSSTGLWPIQRGCSE